MQNRQWLAGFSGNTRIQFRACIKTCGSSLVIHKKKTTLMGEDAVGFT